MRPNQEFSSTNFDLNNFDLNKKYLKYFLPTNVMGLSYCTSLDVILNIFRTGKTRQSFKEKSNKGCVSEYHSNSRDEARAAAASKMERFVIIANGFQPLTIITKRFILDVAAALDPLLNSWLKKLFATPERFGELLEILNKLLFILHVFRCVKYCGIKAIGAFRTCQSSKRELLAKIVTGFQLLSFVAKSYVLGV